MPNLSFAWVQSSMPSQCNMLIDLPEHCSGIHKMHIVLPLLTFGIPRLLQFRRVRKLNNRKTKYGKKRVTLIALLKRMGLVSRLATMSASASATFSCLCFWNGSRLCSGSHFQRISPKYTTNTCKGMHECFPQLRQWSLLGPRS